MIRRLRGPARPLLLLAILAGTPGSAAAPARDVVPPLAAESPRLRFHMGEVENNQPKISPILPAIPGAVSAWYVAQWQQSSYLAPQDLTLGDPATRDPALGRAAYAFTTPDQHAHVWIYRHGGGWVYELYERGGRLSAGGGSNIFLATNVIGPAATFDHTITYTLDAKLSRAAIRYDTPGAEATGAVLAQAFTGFGLMFRDPRDNRQQFVFMQLPLTLSRPIPPGPGYICSLNGGKPNLLYAPAYLAGEAVLAYRADPGELHHLRYGLNPYIRRLVAGPYPCGGETMRWPATAADLRNWRLTGLYVGLETETRDDRPAATTHQPQGMVAVALQLANLQVVRN